MYLVWAFQKKLKKAAISHPFEPKMRSKLTPHPPQYLYASSTRSALANTVFPPSMTKMLSNATNLPSTKTPVSGIYGSE
jgi:hypothetical protein